MHIGHFSHHKLGHFFCTAISVYSSPVDCFLPGREKFSRQPTKINYPAGKSLSEAFGYINKAFGYMFKSFVYISETFE
ncbi:hypothetical protein HMPREF1988_01483 [Porphyromonas gingivalis F0185]|nr:hypothetical protein HMPREF1988_01483 [Porphyromonas gingivalis F0185]